MADLLSIYSQFGLVGLFISVLVYIVWYQHRINQKCHDEHLQDVKKISHEVTEVVKDNTEAITRMAEVVRDFQTISHR